MIEVKNLTYRYDRKSDPAVRSVNFHIPEGEIFGFLGPSGAGKSTTQKVLIGLLQGYQGQVKVFGREISSMRADYYERVGVSFELPNHYRKLTALENLNFFRSLYSGPTEDPNKLLRMVGLGEHGKESVGNYSKGMQMRLGFVRALLNKPKLLFLDEPTSGLDPGYARVIKDIILEQRAQGTTIFLTTHNMTVADELCDRVAFIVDGQIRLIDSPRQLKLQHGQKVVRVEYREDGRSKSKDFSLQGLMDNPEFTSLMRTKQVETLHTLEATLEDVFLANTGVRLS